ncbi:MAG: hypothetical protein NZM00_06290, partial [Anaerolinea sp.]|nr:hypothetical protein [Anaerolinea sp.]
TLQKFIAHDVSDHLVKIGRSIQDGWYNAASEAKLKIHVGGISPLSHFSFDYPNSLAIKTLFTQMMLERGYLASTAFYASYAHTEQHVSDYLNTVFEVFSQIARFIDAESVEKQLWGEIAHTGFKRLVD